MQKEPPRTDSMSGLVCIFAKTPKLGQVKTRLAPALGDQGCLDLHKWLVEQRLQSLAGPMGEQIRLCVTDSLDDPYWQGIAARFPMPIQLQQGPSLGERMQAAAAQVLAQKDWVILVGADCPDLDVDYIQSAINALQEGVQLVIGPAEDGGYVLLGLRRVIPEIFSGIDWGTEQVLSQTLAAFKDSSASRENKDGADSLQPILLPALRDLDVIADLLYYRSKIAALAAIADAV